MDNFGGQLLVECGLTRPHIGESRSGWAAKEEVVYTVVQVVLKLRMRKGNNRDNLGEQPLGECGLTRPQVGLLEEGV